MKCRAMRTVLAGAIFLVTALDVSAAKAEAPDPAVQQVQIFYDALLDSMKHAKELGIKGRYAKLKPVIEQTFDLPDMIKIAVGPDWSTMSVSDRQSLLTAFERMTVANYASNFDSYDGEKIIVDPTTRARGTDRVVQSKLITKNQTVTFGYRLRQTTGGAWKILDVYVNGSISRLATQRSEYNATLATGGAAGLAKKLDELSDKLMSGN
jgi:phospholipid transport system substrate-binding protein